jgi:hypothetical protein
MNLTTKTCQTGVTRRLKPVSGILLGCLLLGIAGCATTRQVKKVEPSGFLGDDYALMHKGIKDRADMYYERPGVDWKKYTKLWIKPVELWKSDDPDSAMGRLSREQQQMLVNVLYLPVKMELGMEFELVDHGGPDTLVFRLAITDAKKSRPVMNLISSVYPAGLALSYGKQLITGKGMGVGDVQLEGEVTDGQTGEVLLCGVDRRVGTKAIRSKFGGSWGDVKLAFTWWAQHFNTRVAELRAGETTPGAN